MTNKPESHSDQSHPEPHKGGKDQYKRHVDGNIRVSGQIEVHPPPNTNNKETPEQEKARSYRFANFVVSALTLIAVVIYAGLAGWQGLLTSESIDNNTKQFRIEQRPYVWYVENIPPKSIHIAKGEQMFINFSWVNYGKTPAIKFTGTGKIHCGTDAGNTVEKWFSLMGDGNNAFPPSLVQGPDRSYPIPPVIPTDPEKPLEYSSIYTDDILTQEQVNYILDTNNACFVGIRTQYFDSYGARYWSDICLMRQKNGVLAHCDTHNEMH